MNWICCFFFSNAPGDRVYVQARKPKCAPGCGDAPPAQAGLADVVRCPGLLHTGPMVHQPHVQTAAGQEGWYVPAGRVTCSSIHSQCYSFSCHIACSSCISLKRPERSGPCLWKLVSVCSAVIELIQSDVTQYPFHQEPPTYLRAHRYKYWFTEPKADGSVASLAPSFSMSYF